MGIYLSPIWHNILPQYRSEFGYIDSIHKGGVCVVAQAGQRWMLDNGVYSGAYTMDAWRSLLDWYAPYASNCLGIVVPDVLHRNANGTIMGDWQATVTQFMQYMPIVRKYGYPVAFVSQDGLPIDAAPWNDFDVLFIGGSDHHKMVESWSLIAEAKRRGKWVHIGRVNSAKRIALFWMADSWDGTTLAIEPSIRNQKRMLHAARRATAKANGQQRSLFNVLYHPIPDSDCAG